MDEPPEGRVRLPPNSIADLAPLAGLTSLQALHCAGTHVADLAPVVQLSDLRLLDARRTRVKGLPRELGHLRALEGASRLAVLAGVARGLYLEENDLADPLPRLIAPGQPEATRNVLAWLRGELDPDQLPPLGPVDPGREAEEPPPLPAPGAGPAVVYAPDGRLALAGPRDLDAAGNNRPRLDALHPAIREAAIELHDALRRQPTNQRNERLLRAAGRYRDLADRPLSEIDFARLFAAGVQLENAERATRAALEAGRADVPDLTPVQDECLGTLTQLHPGFILASREGTEMLADQTAIQLTADTVSAVREAGLAVGDALAARPDLAEPAVGEMIRDAAEEIGQGPNTPRDAATSVSMTRNVVIAVAAGATAISLPLIGSALGGPPGALAGGVASWGLLKGAEKSKAFAAVQELFTAGLDRAREADWAAAVPRLREQRALFLKLELPLRRLAKVPNFSWLDRTLDWLKRQPDPGDKR